MSRARRAGLAAVLLAFAAPAAAGQIYRWIDAAGTVQYSDQPPPRPLTGDLPAGGDAPAKAPVAPARPLTVDELLTVSGLRSQLDGVLSQFRSELRPAQVGPGEQAVIDRVLASTFSAEVLYPVIRDEVARRLEPVKLAAVAAWLQAPLGAAITALEAMPQSSERQQALAAFAAGLAKSPPPAARLGLVERLDWIGGESELLVDLGVITAKSLAMTVRAALPRERRMKPGQIDLQMETLRRRAVPRVREAVLASMLFVYRTLSDEELRQYADFLASDAGRWYGGAVRRGLSLAVRAGAERATSQLVRLLPPERWTPAVGPSTTADAGTTRTVAKAPAP